MIKYDQRKTIILGFDTMPYDTR